MQRLTERKRMMPIESEKLSKGSVIMAVEDEARVSMPRSVVVNTI